MSTVAPGPRVTVVVERAVAEAESGLDFLTGNDPTTRNTHQAILDAYEPSGTFPPIIARSHNALGIIAFKSGNRDEARRHWTAARKVYADLSNKAMVRRMDERLRTLDPAGRR